MSKCSKFLPGDKYRKTTEIELWNEEDGWTKHQFDLSFTIYGHQMLQHRGHTLIIGGNEDETSSNKIYKLDLETSSKKNFLTKMTGDMKLGEARGNHVAFKIPYGYLTNCKGDFTILVYYYFCL